MRSGSGLDHKLIMSRDCELPTPLTHSPAPDYPLRAHIGLEDIRQGGMSQLGSPSLGLSRCHPAVVARSSPRLKRVKFKYMCVWVCVCVS